MRSTIQAVCWGTKRTTVLAGSLGFWKYVGRGPTMPEEPAEELAEMPPGRKAPLAPEVKRREASRR
jgi:hypothetical protein